MRDKPGKNRDFYHSCYSLSGLSISQHGIQTPTGTNLMEEQSDICEGIPEINLHWRGAEV